MKTSIVITYLPVDESVERLTTECLKRVEENTYYPFEIIRVNNNTFRFTHETRNTWRHNLSDDFASVNNDDNFGNGRAWDQGIEEALGDVVILMDNDVWVEKDWDKEIVDRLSDLKVGIAFPYSIVGDELDRLNSGIDVEYKGRRDGFCFGFRKDTYKNAGPFLCDQPFKLGYYEDDWWEYRVQYQLGLKLVACPKSRVWHKGQGTTKRMWSQDVVDGIEKNKAWYEGKTGGVYPYIEK